MPPPLQRLQPCGPTRARGGGAGDRPKRPTPRTAERLALQMLVSLMVLTCSTTTMTTFAFAPPAVSSSFTSVTRGQAATRPMAGLHLFATSHSDASSPTEADWMAVKQEDDRDGDGGSPDGDSDGRSPMAAVPHIRTQLCVTGVSPPRETPLNEAVGRIAGVSLEKANELVEIGAVWARMESLTEADVLAQYDTDREDLTLYADLPRGWGRGDSDFEDSATDGDDDVDGYVARMEAQRYRRILTPTLVQPGTDLRIYPNPRRFPACYDMDSSSLLHQDTTFLVVDKPPLLPTQPDASNYIENCPGCAHDVLGPFYDIQGNEVRRPLLCHRVDSVVGGCVVMAKDRNGQRVFQDLQRQRKVKKLYLAVTTAPVPVGMHLHWMWSPQTARGSAGGPPCQLVCHRPPESRRKARQFWTRCVLEVTKCEAITVASTEEGYDPPPGTRHYQSTIRLVTGRKHQVRAQLSSLGCPIIRDTLYGPMSGLTLGDLEDEENGAMMEEAIAKCRVPTVPIGLQASAILFGGVRAKAGPPWWCGDPAAAAGP